MVKNTSRMFLDPFLTIWKQNHDFWKMGWNAAEMAFLELRCRISMVMSPCGIKTLAGKSKSLSYMRISE